MKKILSLFLCLVFFLPIISLAEEQSPFNIYFFHSEQCAHCRAENIFLDKLENEYGSKIKIHRYEISKNKDNLNLLQQFTNAHNIQFGSVPATFIGQKGIVGFDNEDSYGQQIKQAIDFCLASGCDCPGDRIVQNSSTNQNINQDCSDNKQVSTVVKLPFIGQKDLKEFSLPVLAMVIGALDGFNPCAMWVLLFLITLLLGMQQRWKMWLLGGTFIFASGAVYFLFMAAWLNFLMFLGYVQWIKICIGIFGIVSGILFLREYKKNIDGTCKVVTTDSRKKIFERLKDIVKNPNILLALGGIILLAFTVNLVELACSLGFPAIFTQMLSLANLSSWQYYGYILLYLLFFMIDDLIVFAIAMFTLKITGFNTKYTRYSNLIGGILILIVGLLLIFKPEWLSFS